MPPNNRRGGIMTNEIKRYLISIITTTAMLLAYSSAYSTTVQLADDDIRGLNICAGVIALFSQEADSIWPGYDLSKQPFIFYNPDKWVLLFNSPGQPDGFIEYPSNWPDLGAKALYHAGQYDNLSGQLSFDVQVDTLLVAAVPNSEDSVAKEFGFIVHECFHQYQYHHFGEIPWEREEKYPMLDAGNTALAYLEMQSLMAALKESEVDNKQECLAKLKQFVAIRKARWGRDDNYLTQYERGKELSEGTARYVEIKCLTKFKSMNYQPANGLSDIRNDFPNRTFVDYIINDFNNRITDGAISPENMPRFRIYSMACAQAYLLDYLNINWQDKAQIAGDEFDYYHLFIEHLGLNDDVLDALAKATMTEYKYGEVYNRAQALVDAYKNDYQQALDKFMAQPGIKVKISFSSQGIRRSRSSSATKWLFDNGGIEMREHYRIYSLEKSGLLLQLKDAGLIEKNNWQTNERTVVLFLPRIGTTMIDGRKYNARDNLQVDFDSIEMTTDNFDFKYEGKGLITGDGKAITIDLIKH